MSLVARWESGVLFRSIWLEERGTLFVLEDCLIFIGCSCEHTLIFKVLLIWNGGHIMESLILNVLNCFSNSG